MLTPLSDRAFGLRQLGLKPHKAQALFALLCQLDKMLATGTGL